MRKLVAGLAIAGALLLPGAAFASSPATNAALGLGAFAVFNQILGGVGIFGRPAPVAAAPVVVAPPPVVYAPPAPPVYVAPAPPVVYVPAPVIVRPAPVFVRPVPRAVVVHGHPHWQHSGWGHRGW